jgi:hypothetical protein
MGKATRYCGARSRAERRTRVVPDPWHSAKLNAREPGDPIADCTRRRQSGRRRRKPHYALKREAAPGVDGVRRAEYQNGLEPRLKDLLARWVERKYKKLCGHLRRATWVVRISRVDPKLWAAFYRPGGRRVANLGCQPARFRKSLVEIRPHANRRQADCQSAADLQSAPQNR